ncbi:unnamed protein product [Pieris brassicae]|uniref:Uncharacterized protein n=1 Tax=Pieris brassicae TaxID=7116 RepID=A0A9P0TN45_PIEBR|nr:unnamed protein product [Pieris brassicae]
MYMLVVLNILSTVSSQDLQIFPDISDLFETFNQSSNIAPQGDIIIKNITIDVERVDIEKLKKKLNMSQNIDFTRMNDTRRLGWHGGYYEWQEASRYEVKLKVLDLMLQFIYMARHKVKRLEAERYFNPKDTSYRIAFLYRRLIRIFKRMNDIYSTMCKIKERKSLNMEHQLFLHHKSAKLHVDFLYLWWVLVKLHEKYSLAHGIPNVVPDKYMP